MKAKFMAKEALISNIKELTNLNPVILNYVLDEVELFVTTHHSTIDDEIRYSFYKCNHDIYSTNFSAIMGVL